MTTSLTSSQQGELAEFAERYIVGLRRIADEAERMLSDEACSSMEIAGFLHGSVSEVIGFVPWIFDLKRKLDPP